MPRRREPPEGENPDAIKSVPRGRVRAAAAFLVIAVSFFLSHQSLRAGQAAPAAPADEWPELDLQQPRRSFEEGVFADGDREPRGLSKSQLSRWLAPITGLNHQLHESQRGRGMVAGFDGTLRLRAPWPADAVLSLAPFDHHSLAIYFWNGKQGVSLHYYQHPRSIWVAYATTRKEAEPVPATYALVATDNEVYGRTLGGTLEIRHQNGSLVVSRGDVRLLTAPLAAPPTEVDFDKRAWLREFTMYRSAPFPETDADPAAAERNVLASSTPANLNWTVAPAAGSTLKKTAAGGIELTSEKDPPTAWAGLKVPRPGLYEIIFRFGDVAPGGGFYLGDDQGKPLYVLAVLRDQRTKLPMVALHRPDVNWFEAGGDINNQAVHFIAPGQWFRLVAGSGSLKCWTSGDGRNWSRILEPQRGLRGGWSHVGLISCKWNEPRRITLDSLRIAELTNVAELADEKLAAQVPAAVITGDPNPTAWQTRVTESLPAGIDLAPWRTACAMRTLAAVPPGQLGNLLLNGMAETIIARAGPIEKRLQALDQLADLYDSWDQPDSFRLSQFYERLGKNLLREGDREPWSKVGKKIVTAPIWTNAQFQTMPEPLANAELLFDICAEDWGAVRQLCRQLTLLNRPGPPEQGWPDHRQRVKLLVEWAFANAGRALVEKNRQGTIAAAVPFHWQHPLLANLSKEGFNTLADLEATLGEQSYREACQIITSARPELALGLLPDGRDPRLLLSLPQAVDTSMRDYPGLKATMVEQFGTVGRLRLQQALAEGNPRTVQALAVQFFGTTAAAAAHQWLGDRALVVGEFPWAASQFEEALRSADQNQQAPLAARLRLAAAMLGRDEGKPVAQAVVFQNARLEPDAFERLVAEMKQHALARRGPHLAAAEGSRVSAVKPVRYEVKHRASQRGDVGENPGNPVSGDVDWVARQTAATLAGEMLYLTNRFQVTAFNVKSGNQLWSQPLGKEQALAHGWNLMPSRPVVAGDRLFVRRLAKANPELACLNTANGNVRWATRNTVNVASDPFLLQDRLYVFTAAAPHENGMLTLDFSLVDPATGEIAVQHPVIQLRNLWDKQFGCQTAVVGRRIIAVAGGAVVCCDVAGRPLWVRRQLWIPASQALAANEQSPALPVAIGNRLFVMQPGVFTLECLDLDTGRRIWQQPIPDLRRLIGIAGQRLIVETARGWQAHATATGLPLWQHDGEQILDAQVCPASGELLVSQRDQLQGDQWRPVLVWLDPETGRETARWPLEALADKQPMVGPVIVDSDKLWLLFGRSIREPHRDLYELTPTADPAHPPKVAARQ